MRSGKRLDADIVRGDAFRVVQLTPTHSACSVVFGKGVTTGEPGSVHRLILAVSDVDTARGDLTPGDLLHIGHRPVHSKTCQALNAA
jgi:hypothetical protein